MALQNKDQAAFSYLYDNYSGALYGVIKRVVEAEEIANDLLPRFQKMREEGQQVTVADFDKYMEERGATFELSDSVMNMLVEMGFDFDIEKDDVEVEEPFLKESLRKLKK